MTATSQSITKLFTDLGQILLALGQLVLDLALLAAPWLLLFSWVAWWLWGVNWKKAWAVLGQGAWVPLLLLSVLGAAVWSQIAPSSYQCLGLFTVPNFWWQLGAVGLLVALTLLCGYVQGALGWTPAEVELEPPATEHGHDHGPGHH